MHLAVLVVVWAAFTAWSFTIIASHGLLGFLTLAGREPWAAQMLVDLAIALFVSLSWVRSDAKERGIAAWPYIIATVTFGSMGLLPYFIHRQLVRRTATA